MDKYQEILDSCDERMNSSLSNFGDNLKKIRTGRANPAMLDGIMVDYYGNMTPLNQCCSITVEDSKTLSLSPWDKSLVQEIDKAIPILEKAAKMSKEGKNYVLLGNLYLAEDKLELAIDSIKKGLKKGKISKVSQVHLTLGQAYFELQQFDEAKKQFGIAARDKDKKVIATANNWIRYTENEEVRVKNLALRREFIKNS